MIAKILYEIGSMSSHYHATFSNIINKLILIKRLKKFDESDWYIIEGKMPECYPVFDEGITIYGGKVRDLTADEWKRYRDIIIVEQL